MEVAGAGGETAGGEVVRGKKKKNGHVIRTLGRLYNLDVRLCKQPTV